MIDPRHASQPFGGEGGHAFGRFEVLSRSDRVGEVHGVKTHEQANRAMDGFFNSGRVGSGVDEVEAVCWARVFIRSRSD